jgi:peptidoglycan/xylan/chitin deacetylase (PgdA/CDA1 family)
MLTVSNYHYIRPNFSATFPSIYGMTPDAFKNQLTLLKNKSECIAVADLLADIDFILNSKTNYFLITFDDGLKEQYQNALPILDELQLPAVFFANSSNHAEKKVSTVHKIHLLRSLLSPSDFLNKLSNYYPIAFSKLDKKQAGNTYIYDDAESAAIKYILNFKMDFTIQEEILKKIFDAFFEEEKIVSELYMNAKEINHLAQLSFLGSHTHNHYPIGLLKPEEIQSELQASKLYFQNETKTKIEMVAYPYGSPEACTKEVAEIAQKVGYKLGFTTTRGTNTNENDRLLLNRFDCNDLPGGKNYKAI